MTADAARRVGEQVGNYVLVRLLGKGAMGQVYEAQHVFLGRKAAIKFVTPEFSSNPTMLERFQREARICSALGHPNIVGVYDFGKLADGSFYYAMEYLEGQPLDAYVGRSLQNWPWFLEVFRQVCLGLKAAHRAGVLHRDLKPANVFVTRDTEGRLLAKILDFGIAKLTVGPDASLTQKGAYVGTPLYSSPEQAQGQSLDPRSDIYSLGAVMYHVLTGQPPFVGPTPTAVLLKHVTEPPPPMPRGTGLPEALCQLVERMLAKDPAARPASVEEVLRRLESILAEPRPGVAFQAASQAGSPGPAVLPAAATGPSHMRPADGPGSQRAQSEKALAATQPASAKTEPPPPPQTTPGEWRPASGHHDPVATARLADTWDATETRPPSQTSPSRMGVILSVVVLGILLAAGGLGLRFLLVGRRSGPAHKATRTKPHPTKTPKRQSPLPGPWVLVPGAEGRCQLGLARQGDRWTCCPGTPKRRCPRAVRLEHEILDCSKGKHPCPRQAYLIGAREIAWRDFCSWSPADEALAAEHRALCRGERPALGAVQGVSWKLARAYCRSFGGDLPTEYQWEYAARWPVLQGSATKGWFNPMERWPTDPTDWPGGVSGPWDLIRITGPRVAQLRSTIGRPELTLTDRIEGMASGRPEWTASAFRNGMDPDNERFLFVAGNQRENWKAVRGLPPALSSPEAKRYFGIGPTSTEQELASFGQRYAGLLYRQPVCVAPDTCAKLARMQNFRFMALRSQIVLPSLGFRCVLKFPTRNSGASRPTANGDDRDRRLGGPTGERRHAQ